MEIRTRRKGNKEERTPTIFSFFPLLYHNTIINVRGKVEINLWGNLLSQTCNQHFGLVNCQISNHVCSVWPNSVIDVWRILNLYIHHLSITVSATHSTTLYFFLQLNGNLLKSKSDVKAPENWQDKAFRAKALSFIIPFLIPTNSWVWKCNSSARTQVDDKELGARNWASGYDHTNELSSIWD